MKIIQGKYFQKMLIGKNMGQGLKLHSFLTMRLLIKFFIIGASDKFQLIIQMININYHVAYIKHIV